MQQSERMAWAIREAAELIDTMVTHEFPLDEVEDAWKLQLTGQCGKVLLYPNR